MVFPTTNWTKLAEATLSGGEVGREALGWICEKYHRPVEVVIRQSGVVEERVEDVRQDFFLALMEGSFFRSAEIERGKFRNFLLRSLKNFLIDDWRRQVALKRGGSLSRVELRDDIASFKFDECEFDLAWAEALFSAAMKSVESEFKPKRGLEGWQMLRGFLIGVERAASYLDLGRVLGISEGGAKSEVYRMRAKFRDYLRYELRQTVSAPHEVDEELSYLSMVMSRVWGNTDV